MNENNRNDKEFDLFNNETKPMFWSPYTKQKMFIEKAF